MSRVAVFGLGYVGAVSVATLADTGHHVVGVDTNPTKVEVLVYDRNVSLAHLHGANREYIQREIPHISSMMRDDLESIVRDSSVIVIGNRDPEFERLAELSRPDQTIIDLVRLDSLDTPLVSYRGIAW